MSTLFVSCMMDRGFVKNKHLPGYDLTSGLHSDVLKLEMDDNDIIDAVLQQTGGSYWIFFAHSQIQSSRIWMHILFRQQKNGLLKFCTCFHQTFCVGFVRNLHVGTSEFGELLPSVEKQVTLKGKPIPILLGTNKVQLINHRIHILQHHLLQRHCRMRARHSLSRERPNLHGPR